MDRLRQTLVVALALAAAAAGCGGHTRPGRPLDLPPAGAAAGSQRSHLITIVMENKEYGDVVGNAAAPYTNRLARRYGVATASYGVRHPSLPNYLALTSGSTHGITSNCTGCHIRARNIVDQLEAARRSWKGYMEDMPKPCFTGAHAGGYAKKHDPFVYYDDIVAAPRRCGRVVPYTELAADLRGRRLPAYSVIVPNLCDDTHDCDVATGDRFLAHLVPVLLAALGPRGLLVLTYDEGTSDAGCCGIPGGGRIATIVAGPGVRRGARDGRPVDHYGVLRTTEDALGLPRLAAAADRRHGSLRGLFARPPRVR
jgi:predicted small lipoprotein YifL